MKRTRRQTKPIPKTAARIQAKKKQAQARRQARVLILAGSALVIGGVSAFLFYTDPAGHNEPERVAQAQNTPENIPPVKPLEKVEDRTDKKILAETEPTRPQVSTEPQQGLPSPPEPVQKEEPEKATWELARDTGKDVEGKTTPDNALSLADTVKTSADLTAAKSQEIEWALSVLEYAPVKKRNEILSDLEPKIALLAKGGPTENIRAAAERVLTGDGN